MAFDFKKPDELDRVVGIAKLATWQEFRRVCVRTDAWLLAKQLGIQPDRRESVLVKRLWDYINGDDFDKGPKCNCELPEGLRWLEGKASFFYDDRDQPRGLDFSPIEQMRKAAKAWEGVCGIKLTEDKSASEADIVITWADIDGIGKTLGMAYQPVSGEDMAACGGPCGDIIMDWSEPWNQTFFYAVFLHEIGHAIGIPHAPTNDGSNIMEAFYTGRVIFGPWDIEQAVERYLQSGEFNVERTV